MGEALLSKETNTTTNNKEKQDEKKENDTANINLPNVMNLLKTDDTESEDDDILMLKDKDNEQRDDDDKLMTFISLLTEENSISSKIKNEIMSMIYDKKMGIEIKRFLLKNLEKN